MMYKKIIIFLITIVTVLSGFNSFVLLSAEENVSIPVYEGLSSKNSYSNYINNHKNVKTTSKDVVIDCSVYSKTDMKIEKFTDFGGVLGESVLTSEEGFIEWTFDVPESALYNLKIMYYPYSGKGTKIEREIYIDGKLPFSECSNIALTRLWVNDSNGIKNDSRGNNLTIKQVESPVWTESYFEDITGAESKPYYFYLSKGRHIAKFVSVKEPVLLGKLIFSNFSDCPNYSDYIKKSAPEIANYFYKIQGEDSVLKSSSTLVPVNDRTSTKTEPYNVSKIRLNAFGGIRWQNSGEWAKWEFEVPETGYYNIAVKFKQDQSKVILPTRKIYIDDVVPFSEMKKYSFKYNTDWQIEKLNADENNYEYYLEKGSHSIKMEVTLGNYSKYIKDIQNSLYVLNEAYRKIVMITGVVPDAYRDYRIPLKLPEVLNTFKEQSEILSKISKDLEGITLKAKSELVPIDTLASQIKDFSTRPETIQTRLDKFESNISGLSGWLLTSQKQSLLIDYMLITGKENPLPNIKSSLWERFSQQMLSLMNSFFEDYNTLDSVDKDNTIDVWMSSGKDQANILKTLIDSSFSNNSGIGVNLKLATGAPLTNAIVAGIAPDAAIEVGNSDPVNYALRNAVVNLAAFPDFNTVKKQFYESAITPFRLNDGVYALPERQGFYLMFYRADILEQMGLTVPKTWDELMAVLVELRNYNMEIGIPAGGSGDVMTMMATLLYQQGQEIYKDKQTLTAFDTKISLNTFKKYTEFFTNYGLPLYYDSANRFRTGEMPVIISDYSLYNTLSIFAPEIKGLWKMTGIPGFKKAEGIDNTVATGSIGSIILSQSKKQKQAWEFIKWWTSSDIQAQFGKELESLLGEAARYPTANIAAMEQLPWRRSDYKILKQQWEKCQGIPEIPGSYFVPRNLDNAFRTVINENSDAKQTLLNYIDTINKELESKRSEFSLEKRMRLQ
jgi:ABC-type glycerol-3-phosphate transport system substrate-binding protein